MVHLKKKSVCTQPHCSSC